MWVLIIGNTSFTLDFINNHNAQTTLVFLIGRKGVHIVDRTPLSEHHYLHRAENCLFSPPLSRVLGWCSWGVIDSLTSFPASFPECSGSAEPCSMGQAGSFPLLGTLQVLTQSLLHGKQALLCSQEMLCSCLALCVFILEHCCANVIFMKSCLRILLVSNV